MRRVRAQEVDWVIVLKVSLLSRSLRDLATTVETTQHVVFTSYRGDQALLSEQRRTTVLPVSEWFDRGQHTIIGPKRWCWTEIPQLSRWNVDIERLCETSQRERCSGKGELRADT